MIRNYLGFPRGIGGGELAHRAWQQAVLLGAEFSFTHAVARLSATDVGQLLELDDGVRVTSRAVILASGVTYRRLGVPDLDRLTGAGVFYGAAGGWLAPALALDDHGFVLTGRDVPADAWPLGREPYPFETSRPGVFAAGDVRHSSVKRVAGSVGEGSVAVGSVHRYLAEAATVAQPSGSPSP
jgi:thioredoxin reductase (NADPH)